MRKNHWISFLGLFLVSMTFCSCATLLSKKQTVTVTSDVDDALVYKGKKYVGRTPLTFQTKAAKQTFTVTKEGYEPQKRYTSVGIRWNTLWNWFNCWTGWFVDIATGSTQKYLDTEYFVSLKDPSINEAHNSRQETRNYKNITLKDAAEILLPIAANTAAEIQSANAQKKAEEAIKKEQELAEQQARVVEAKARAAEQQADAANSPIYQIQPINTSQSQGSYNDLLTSDPTWNQQVIMSVQQYGVEKTREIINQQRINQQQLESTTGGYGGEIISAVTSNRRAIKIQIRDRKIGGKIVAYSEGGNFAGKQQWIGTQSLIQKCTSNLEYKYTAYIKGLGNIYFDL